MDHQSKKNKSVDISPISQIGVPSLVLSAAKNLPRALTTGDQNLQRAQRENIKNGPLIGLKNTDETDFGMSYCRKLLLLVADIV